MGKGCQLNVVIYINPDHFISKAFRAVAIALVVKCGRFFTEVGIQHTVKGTLPCRGDGARVLVDNGIYYAFERSFHFIVIVVVCAIVQAFISRLGYCAIMLDNIKDIKQCAAL